MYIVIAAINLYTNINMLNFQLATAEEVLRELGQRLRAQRMARLITQQELAARAGVALGAVKKLETSGASTLNTFVRVIQALSLTDELAGILQIKASSSIAEMERAELSKRKRARRPRGA